MDPDTIRQARAYLPPDTVYADWAASALPLPLPSPKFLPPVHTPSHASLASARHSLHNFFHDTHHAYHIIFTSGTTAALQLLANRLPWSLHSNFIAHTHVHNAVLGIRNPALAAGATFRSVSSAQLQQALSTPTHLSATTTTTTTPAAPTANETSPPFTLLAYSAECNLTGTLYPLSWSTLVKRNGLFSSPPSNVITLVDTAKFLTTSPLNLDAHPSIDAFVFSSYKLCASHTGLGALVIRKHSLLEELLRLTAPRSYFSGGRGVYAVTPFSERLFVPAENLEQQLEFGTPNLQAIDALAGVLERFSPAEEVMQRVRERAVEVAGVFRGLMKEAFGKSGVVFYGEGEEGCIVAFTLWREETGGGRRAIGHTEVGRILEMGGIYARVGCMCNAGACASVLGLSDEDVARNYERGVRCGEGGDFVEGKGTGVVRVSFGWGSLREDGVKIVRVLREFVCTRVGRGMIGNGGRGRGRVSEMWLYAVKGCGGSMVQRVKTGEAGGMVGDRVYRIQYIGGGMVSVRECGELAGMRAWWEGERVGLWMEGSEKVVYGGACKEDTKVQDWLRRVLNISAGLVQVGKENRDVLVVWEKELDEIRAECGISRKELIRAVRPNIVMEAEMGTEGGWDVLAGEGVRLLKKRECTRCGVVNLIAGWSGNVGKGEPLRSIGRVGRRRERGGLVFGVLYSAEGGRGEIKVGDVLVGERLSGA